MKLHINEDVNIPSKGYSLGYISTIKIKPTINCTGIPEQCLKYICSIDPVGEVDTWDVDKMYVSNGKVYSSFGFKSNTLMIYFDCREDDRSEDEIYEEFINYLESAGWIIL